MTICNECGKKLEPYKRAHDCDGGEALRKAARELFAPSVPLIEAILAKAGTGILRGVFEVVEQRDRMAIALTAAEKHLTELRMSTPREELLELIRAALRPAE